MPAAQRLPRPDRGVTEDDAAEILGVKKRAVTKLTKSRELPSYKVGVQTRILLSAIRAYQHNQLEQLEYEAAIQRIVDAAPELTAAQRDRLAALLDDGDVA